MISKREDGGKFKYVANICMHRGVMHIGLIILASKVRDKLKGIADGRTVRRMDGSVNFENKVAFSA